MGIINAVLVMNGGFPRWVTDAGSITSWGRIEGTMSVGSISDPATVDALGAAYLLTRAQPIYSSTLQVASTTGAVAGVDYREGDTVSTDGTTLRCVELAFNLAADGTMQATPGMISPLEQQVREADNKLDRMIADAGGATPISSPPIDTGSGVPTGKLNQRQVLQSSWQAATELADATKWHDSPVSEPMRVAEIVLAAKDITATTGPTTFRLQRNGADLLSIPAFGSVPTEVTLTSSQTYKAIPVFGHTLFVKGDTLRLYPTVNGGHAVGSVTAFGTDAV